MKRDGIKILASASLMLLTASLVSAAPPSAPTGLTVTTVLGQCKQLKLTWTDTSTNEDDFHIERAPDVSGVPGTFVEIVAFPTSSKTGTGSRTYTDSTVADDTPFWYRVRAHEHTGNTFSTTYSNNASGNTGMICTPTGLIASPLISSCVKMNLSWTDNSNVDSNYLIERTVAAGTCASAFTQIASIAGNGSTTGSRSYQDTTVTGGTKYAYRVRASGPSPALFSAYSNCATNTTTACGSTK